MTCKRGAEAGTWRLVHSQAPEPKLLVYAIAPDDLLARLTPELTPD